MFGTIFQVSLLLINAIAILNEERFLARSTSLISGSIPQTSPDSTSYQLVGSQPLVWRKLTLGSNNHTTKADMQARTSGLKHG